MVRLAEKRLQIGIHQAVPRGQNSPGASGLFAFEPAGDAAHLLLVFRSTCPTCEQALPAWNRLARSSRWRTTAIGLETAGAAAAYASERIPAARVAVPRDPDRFTRRFRISVVPTTLVIDRGGRLVARHAGPLEEADLEALRLEADSSAP